MLRLLHVWKEWYQEEGASCWGEEDSIDRSAIKS
jgi:hypothetical protein